MLRLPVFFVRQLCECQAGERRELTSRRACIETNVIRNRQRENVLGGKRSANAKGADPQGSCGSNMTHPQGLGNMERRKSKGSG